MCFKNYTVDCTLQGVKQLVDFISWFDVDKFHIFILTFFEYLALGTFFSRSTFFGTSSVCFIVPSGSCINAANRSAMGRTLVKQWHGVATTASLNCCSSKTGGFDLDSLHPWKINMEAENDGPTCCESFRETKWFTYYEPNLRQSPTNPDILGSPTITTGDYQTLHPWKINMETQGMMVGRRLVSFWDGIFSGTSC